MTVTQPLLCVCCAQVYLTRGIALHPDSHQAAMRRVHSFYLSFPYIQRWRKLCQDHRTVLQRRKIAATGKTHIYLIPPVVTGLLTLIHHIISTVAPNECVCGALCFSVPYHHDQTVTHHHNSIHSISCKLDNALFATVIPQSMSPNMEVYLLCLFSLLLMFLFVKLH
jgi:hypothetical protein